MNARKYSGSGWLLMAVLLAASPMAAAHRTTTAARTNTASGVQVGGRIITVTLSPTVTFIQPIANPVIHLSGSGDTGGRTDFNTRPTLAGGLPPAAVTPGTLRRLSRERSPFSPPFRRNHDLHESGLAQ